MKKIILPALLLCIGLLSSFTPAENFRQYYGEAYEAALNFLKQNQQSFRKTAQEHRIDEKSLKAIVFPELLRFNLLQNLFETKALELLYVNGGSQRADFSIGHFQMKPSFAETVEAIAAENEAEEFQAVCSYGNLTDETAIRKKRIERLSDLEWQIKYLACFYRFAEQKLDKNLPKTEKIRKIAAYYNCGIHKSEADLEKLMRRPSFPYGYSVKPEIQHVYSDISLFYYIH